MPWIETHKLDPSTPLPPHERLQVYCGLDSCVTKEIYSQLLTLGASHAPERNSPTPAIYDFERALQAPYLQIMQRGFAVDETARQHATQAINSRIEILSVQLSEFAAAVWGKTLNPRSPKQLLEFFYGAMKLPEVWISQKGQRKLSTNRESLEKLEQYLYARPIVSTILAIRELAKQLEVFETEIDSDGRFRTSYNIAGTESGRPSSSSNAFGTGGNAQNIAPALRYIFVADPGYKLCVIDLEQVEARDVGFFEGCLFGDWKFLDNCESGDLHTNNCKLIWPEEAWTGDPVADRKVADKTFYRDFSYRDMSKRGGHLCLTPDHEVLTPNGWVPISHKPIQMLSFSEEKSQFEEVLNWTDEMYSGDLHSFEGNSISALMTAKHKVPYRSDQRHGKIKSRTAEQGPGEFMPLGWGYVGGTEEVPARLIAAFMADGHQKSTNRIDFHMKKERKFERLKYLCELYGYGHFRDGDRATVVAADFPKRCHAGMLNWTVDCLKDFVDEYKYWDGHISETAVALFSVDKEHIEWLQTFGRILGTGGQIKKSRVKSTFSGTSKEHITDYYALGQNSRQYATGKSVKHTVLSTQFREGSVVRVLCPTVNSGYFYVRRNGKIFVTGNSNYMGTAWTASRSLKVPLKIMETFQERYCRGDSCAFPAHQQWWQWTATQLQTTHQITTPFGRRRHFFGRPGDDTTLREAIAFLPQSTTADRMNLGLWRVWKHMPEVQLLAQTYDSITFQYAESEDEPRIISKALELIRVELTSHCGRRYVVPGEAKVGWNWASAVGQADVEKAKAAGKRPPRLNLEGLVKWSPKKPDLRTRGLGIKRIML